jgi:DNA-binding NarL/FixJ family response regulator
LKIVVIDNHEYFRNTLVGFLRDIPEVERVGEASNGLEGVEMVRRMKPEVVVMDIKMPGMNGIEAAALIKHYRPSVKVILYSMYEFDIYDTEELKVADMVISKHRLFEELVSGIRRIL